ncbi:IclR family transcriptional regulator [Halorussus salinisoli]|uniref:IclR family transcriptional regulator n=1 Tax=Halorussus salinisoli TaxID=2558242 RepID=UPI001485B2AE|nr:IclR family transcriptional regulator [Halorussus salinisoli]
MEDESGDQVNSVSRTFDIIEALKKLNGAGVSQVAEHAGIPTSTAYNYLNTLQAREYVVKEGSEYHLANRFIHLGDFAKNRLQLVNVVKREIEPLLEETGGTVNVVVEEFGLGIYAYSRTAATGLQNFAHVRKREHLHSTAAGKSILANLPDGRVTEILETRGVPQKTSSTIVDEEELYEELARIEERGYALNDEENTPGIRAVGAPIRTGEETCAAVSVAGPLNRFTDEMFYEELPGLVRNTSKSVEVDIMS